MWLTGRKEQSENQVKKGQEPGSLERGCGPDRGLKKETCRYSVPRTVWLNSRCVSYSAKDPNPRILQERPEGCRFVRDLKQSSRYSKPKLTTS